MKSISIVLLFVSLSFVSISQAYEIDTYEFENKEQSELYGKMIKELRCLVCQNNNLADSNSELAQDLRRQTFELVNKGLDEQGIIDYMVKRYGDFVLYRPQMKSTTIILWVGPFILLLLGVVVLLRMIRRRNLESDEAFSEENKKAATDLLAGEDK